MHLLLIRPSFRSTAAAWLLVVSLVGGTAGGPAQAAALTASVKDTAVRIDVHASRFPSVHAIARIFPASRGGRRAFLPGRQLSLTTSDCLYWDLASTQPRAGSTASYSDRNGEAPYFYGGASPVVSLYDFRKPKRAQAALDEQRNTIESCYGRQSEGDGYASIFSRLDAPTTIGQDRFSYREVNVDVNTGRDWTVYTFAREGRFLVLSFVQHDRRAPTAKSAFLLARLSVSSLS